MMQTEHIQVNPAAPEAEKLAKAAAYIYKNELLAFPTETVYGLGAKADRPDALQKIFVAKGRPQERPLLVHVNSPSQIWHFAADIPPTAELLIENFWPGPLALILPARANIPQPLLGPGQGVGFRCPANKVALELLRLTGPLAAPSANLSGHPSPLTAEHVHHGLHGRIAALLDAGPVELGLESTVLDLTGSTARILRIGSIAPEKIAHCLGFLPALPVAGANDHYQMKSQLIISRDQADFEKKLRTYQNEKRNFKLVITQSAYDIYKRSQDYSWYLPEQQNNFFDLLHHVEQTTPEIVLFTPINLEQDVSPGIKDRLQRSISLSED